MTRSRPKLSITQLAFQRKWMLARIDCASLTADEEAALLDDLEDMDLRIAATPCDTVQSLYLKIERLAELIYPSDQPVPEDCLEHVMLVAVVNGAKVLGQTL
jgi:hypothetical protein